MLSYTSGQHVTDDLYSRHLASFGAAITVLTLGMDPLTQQVLTYPTRLVPSGTCSAPRAFEYNELNRDLTVPLPMKAATYNAVFGGIRH